MGLTAMTGRMGAALRDGHLGNTANTAQPAPRREVLAVYPGSFDPVTLGHVAVARQALQSCDRLVLAVGHNPNKIPAFSVTERLAMLRHEFADEPRVEVDAFDGWLAVYARHRGASTVIRGVRDWQDRVQEGLMMGVNFCLGLGLHTHWVQAAPQHVATSSSLARQRAAHGESLAGVVSNPVAAALRARLAPRPTP